MMKDFSDLHRIVGNKFFVNLAMTIFVFSNAGANIKLVNAATTDCAGGNCEVSHLESRIVVNSYRPGVELDSSLHRFKTAGGMQTWEVGGRDVSFASGYYLRLPGWDSEEFGFGREFDSLDYATQSDDIPPEINMGISNVYESSLNVDVRYRLIDYNQSNDAIPAMLGAVEEIITITNASGEPMSFDWFVYHDFDVGESTISDRSLSFTGQGGIEQHFNHADRPRRTLVNTRRPLVHQDGTVQGSSFDGVKFSVFDSVSANDLPEMVLSELLDGNPTTFGSPPAATIRDYAGNDFTYGVQFHFDNVIDSVSVRIVHQVFRQHISEPDFILSANEDHSVNVHFEGELEGTFYPPLSVGEDLGANYSGFSVADFTGNNKLDFIAATDETPPQLYLFARSGPDEFTQTHIGTLSGSGIPDYGLGLTVADLDNDGDMDFLENRRHTYSNGSWFGKGNSWINNGSGSFTRVADSYDFTGIYQGWTLSMSSTLGDFNGDGFPDLLASSQSSGSNTSSPVYILAGGLGGTFGMPQYAFESAAVAATFMTVGDFNNDGLADAVVGGDDDGDPGAAHLYLGSHTGSFTHLGEVLDLNPENEGGSNQAGWGSFRAYDVNHDGVLDVIAGSALNGPNNPDNSSNLVWFEGVGDGSFDPGPGGAGITIVSVPFDAPLPYPSAFSSPISIVPINGDFNGDRCVDREDLTSLISAIRAGATEVEYDLNGDGNVNIADARKLVLLFSHSRGVSCQ